MPDAPRVLTVQHALTLEPLLSAIVKAGASGLNAPIRAVHVLEQPELTPWVRGGELLLSTGLSWDFSDDEAREFVRSAALLGIHGNTLKYRLSRLETLLDFSAGDPQAVFGLTLAAQVRRIQR